MNYILINEVDLGPMLINMNDIVEMTERTDYSTFPFVVQIKIASNKAARIDLLRRFEGRLNNVANAMSSERDPIIDLYSPV